MKGCYHSSMKPFPPLRFSDRVREFNCYSEEQRTAVVYHWLVTGMATREMDEKILGFDSTSKGYQSHGIYRYLGLDRHHQGFFKGWAVSDIIAYFHQLCMDPDYCVIFYYLLDYLDIRSLTEAELCVVEATKEYQPEDNLKNQTWIRNTWVRGTKETKDINSRLLALPDIPDDGVGKVTVSKNRTEYYSNVTVKETIKNLYDFRCQVCGDVILRKGWFPGIPRVDSWRFLSADVHHVLPLSDGGPDIKSNMLCLCPTCHRKFHSGEFRLRSKAGGMYVRDELLGKDLGLTALHQLVLY